VTIELLKYATLCSSSSDRCFGEIISYCLKVDNGDCSIFTCCIFQEDICFKMEKAFCPPKLAEGNPCLEYIKYIILPWFGMFEVVQKKGNGGKK
jgi:hypothetical protein